LIFLQDAKLVRSGVNPLLLQPLVDLLLYALNVIGYHPDLQDALHALQAAVPLEVIGSQTLVSILEELPSTADFSLEIQPYQGRTGQLAEL